MSDFTCIQCRKEKVKELQGEERPHFCSKKCATAYALNVAKRIADCPKCGSTLTHWRGGGYYYDNDRRCSDCGHSWEPK